MEYCARSDQWQPNQEPSVGIKERREREREARRNAVLGAARELVRENGFVATTTRQIAKRCELSEAALFWYFKSKDEIFVSLLFEGITFIASGLGEIEASRSKPERKLGRLWKFFTAVRQEHPEFFHVFQYLATPNSTASVRAEVREDIVARSNENFRCLARILEEVCENPRDSRVAADLLWGSFMGLSLLGDSRLNLGTEGYPNAAQLKRAFTFLVEGILPR
jgi:AcrR family transcriptional regulator